MNKNIQIVKYIIDTKNNILLDIPTVNPACISHELNLLSEITESKLAESKLAENKEHYNLVECPLIIQAAIAGSWDLFKYFQESTKSNINVAGHIGLSKKKKNSIISNVFGAACFYGHFDFIKNLLSQYKGI